MIVETFMGSKYAICPSELYIKPFYNAKNIIYYCLCSNVENKEIELGKYSEYKYAKYMMMNLCMQKFADTPVNILNEQQIEKWEEGTNKLLRAVMEN